MGENTSYCICRSSDSSRFMIGCDSCNEWYHGDCISITEQLAKTITKFYCLICRDRNPSLKIQYHKESSSKSSNKQGNVRKKKQPSSRPNKVARIDDDDSSLEKMDFEDDNDEDFDDDDDQDETFRIENELSEKNSRKSKPRSRPSRKKTNTTSTDNKRGSKKAHRQKEREIYEVDDGLRQCYGPGCINIARRGSKYCSDPCGLKLAHNRILEILPERIRFWQSTPSSADAFSNRELEAIRKEGENAKKVLAELDVKQKELEAMIADAKKLPPISEDEVDEAESGDTELMIYCVTCGHEIASRTAMRHMERCFNKFESQISFGGVNKTKVEGVFCDVFNPHQKTYCMRLKVLCPEHTKEQRIPDNEVCGFPLVVNCFEPTGQFCRVPKKKCMRHYCWEKLRRAQIDMEKVQKWLKLEELFEKETKIRATLTNRGAVLGLLLHHTVIHD